MIVTTWLIKTKLREIRKLVKDGDHEAAHGKRDDLYELVLGQIAECRHNHSSSELAQEVLRAKKINIRGYA